MASMQTTNRILCCLCGTSIEPNAVAMCIDCLKHQHDISDGIAKHCEIIRCGKCLKWKVKHDHWMFFELESGNLMTTCLKMISGLQNQQTRILDSSWVWTEPHSQRLKIAVDIEKEVMDDRIKLRQRFITEFVIKNKQCIDCIRESTDHTWGSMIQLRQNVGHTKTFHFLESLLVKSQLYTLMTDITVVKEGLDMFFRTKTQSERVLDFISKYLPVRTKQSRKVVSRDSKQGTANIEHTTYVEVVPLCKYDLVLTSPLVTGSQEVMVVTKVTHSVHLLSPVTMARAELPAAKYYLKPFDAIMTPRQFTEFIVLDIRVLPISEAPPAAISGPSTTGSRRKGGGGGKDTMESVMSVFSDGIVYAEATVMREADIGVNDMTYIVNTHLGGVLRAGDTVLGYDLTSAVLPTHYEQWAEHQDGKMKKNGVSTVPEIVLVRRAAAKKEEKLGGGGGTGTSRNGKPLSQGGGSGGRKKARQANLAKKRQQRQRAGGQGRSRPTTVLVQRDGGKGEGEGGDTDSIDIGAAAVVVAASSRASAADKGVPDETGDTDDDGEEHDFSSDNQSDDNDDDDEYGDGDDDDDEEEYWFGEMEEIGKDDDDDSDGDGDGEYHQHVDADAEEEPAAVESADDAGN